MEEEEREEQQELVHDLPASPHVEKLERERAEEKSWWEERKGPGRPNQQWSEMLKKRTELSTLASVKNFVGGWEGRWQDEGQ